MATNDPKSFVTYTDLTTSNVFLDCTTYSATGTATNYTITGTVAPSPQVFHVDAEDIQVGDWSLKQELDKINERLAILRPDPDLLEKYEALRNAYEHYKTLEALLKDHTKKSK